VSPAGRLAAKRVGNYAVFMGVVGGLWQAMVLLLAIPLYLLPPPTAIMASFAGSLSAIGEATLFTVACTIGGLAIATLVALGLATAFTASARTSRALMPLILIIRTVPMIAVAPLVVILFGRGPGNSIGMVALMSFFQIMLAAKKGLMAPGANMLELMHVYGAGFWRTQTKICLPFAVPYIFTGLRIAAGSAILSAMFAEWLSGAPGLGRLILDAYSTQDFPLMWATVLASTTAAYFFFTATMVIERLVLDRSR